MVILPAMTRRPTLALHGVDVYLVPLHEVPAELDLLDADERRRAARFVFERDRRRYVGAHVALRQLLASYVDSPPAALRWQTGRHGKPHLSDHAMLQFSLSHSVDSALIAVSVAPTMAAGIGVDLECLPPHQPLDALAQHICTSAERAALSRMAQSALGPALLALWTRKEAVLKACGLGLTMPPHEVEVGMTLQPCVVQVSGVQPTHWQVITLPVQAGVAALALPHLSA